MNILNTRQALQSGCRALLITVLALGISLPALAKPAKPGIITTTQPDGTELSILLHGDERGHIATTIDGYPLTWDQKLGYVYASVSSEGKLISSRIKATNERSRTSQALAFLAKVNKDDAERAYNIRRANARITPLPARTDQFTDESVNGPQRGPGLFPGTHFPAMGQQKGLVILVEYKDVKFDSKNSANYKYAKYQNAKGTTSTANDYWTEMLNREGFSGYNNKGTGSCRDFFIQNSLNDGQSQFIPDFDLYGPVTLSQNMSYYGGNSYSGDDQHPEMMVVEACQLLDSQINFRDYDRDNDGYVDNVYIFYAGKGEADGGGSDTVWPHSWNLSSAGESLTLDGVKIDRYGCSNETDNQTGAPDGIGTFVHEFSHVMGLPDLYATSYTSAYTPGAYSCMDYGPYNNNGQTPPAYSAFERYALSWITPKEFKKEKNYDIEPIYDTNECYIVKTEKSNEFFLVESRPQKNWDKYIPGHGMLIWHIDYNSSIWDSNRVNNTASHQYVDLIEANNRQNSAYAAGHPFPGTNNVTSYNFSSWANKSCGIHFTEISENVNTGTITLHAVNDNYVKSPNDDKMFDHVYYFINNGNIKKTTIESWIDYSDNNTLTLGAIKPNVGVDITGIYVKVDGQSKEADTVNSDKYNVATFNGPFTAGQRIPCEITFNHANGAASLEFTIVYGSKVEYKPNAPFTFTKSVNKIATGTTKAFEMINTQNLPLTYSIADTTIATVDANGNVTALKNGTTTLTATFAGNDSFAAGKSETQVTVGKIDAPISMTKLDYTAAVAQTFALEISNEENLPIIFTSADPAIASISEDGNVTGQGIGATTVTASFAGNDGYDPVTFTANITVIKGDAPIGLLSYYYEVEEGVSTDLEISNSWNLPLIFISSNSSIATVDENGRITGVAPGKTKVAAAFGGNDLFWGSSVIANVNVVKGSGINTITTDNDNTEYFDLTGNRISQPKKGTIVIRVSNGKATKMVMQ